MPNRLRPKPASKYGLDCSADKNPADDISLGMGSPPTEDGVGGGGPIWQELPRCRVGSVAAGRGGRTPSNITRKTDDVISITTRPEVGGHKRRRGQIEYEVPIGAATA